MGTQRQRAHPRVPPNPNSNKLPAGGSHAATALARGVRIGAEPLSLQHVRMYTGISPKSPVRPRPRPRSILICASYLHPQEDKHGATATRRFVYAAGGGREDKARARAHSRKRAFRQHCCCVLYIHPYIHTYMDTYDGSSFSPRSGAELAKGSVDVWTAPGLTGWAALRAGRHKFKGVAKERKIIINKKNGPVDPSPAS